jgi:hypothetical protein
MQEHTINTVRHGCWALLATFNLTTSVFYGWLCGAKLFHTMHLTSSNCTESGKRANPCKECEWLPSDQYRDIQTIDYCAYTVYRVPPFTNLLRSWSISNLPCRRIWQNGYLQHCLRFLAAALMLFPLALATTSRVWSGRSYIYKIANWRSDNTLQASILSVAQKQS